MSRRTRSSRLQIQVSNEPKDNFVYCTDCDDFFLDGCRSHPLYITFGTGSLGVGPSRTQIGDKGVFNHSEKSTLKTSTLLGPYMGDFIKLNQYREDGGEHSNPMVELLDSHLRKVIGYIQPGKDMDPDLRWASIIKATLNTQDQNVSPVQYRGAIYFQVIKDIHPQEELLMSYYRDCPKRAIDKPPGNSKMTCFSCEALIPEKEALQRHLKACGRGSLLSYDTERGYACDFCESWITTWRDFRYHMNKLHAKIIQLKCCDCDEAFDHKKALQRHHKRHHFKRVTHSCSQCSKTFVRSSSLNYHIKSIHLKNRNHSCSQCSRSFFRNSDLQHHIKSFHTKQRDFHCSQCKQAFIQKSTLVKHIKIVHQQLRNHKCSHCGLAFGVKSTLDIHIKAVHEKVRNHQCPRCSMAFTRRSVLLNHIKSIHENIRNHKCTQCKLAFSQASTLKNHIKSVHQQLRDQVCPHCSRTFSIKGQLNHHIKKEHEKL